MKKQILKVSVIAACLISLTSCFADNAENSVKSWDREILMPFYMFALTPGHYVDVSYGARLFVYSNGPFLVNLDCTLTGLPMKDRPALLAHYYVSDDAKKQTIDIGAATITDATPSVSFALRNVFINADNSRLTLDNLPNGVGCPNDGTRCTIRLTCVPPT